MREKPQPSTKVSAGLSLLGDDRIPCPKCGKPSVWLANKPGWVRSYRCLVCGHRFKVS